MGLDPKKVRTPVRGSDMVHSGIEGADDGVFDGAEDGTDDGSVDGGDDIDGANVRSDEGAGDGADDGAADDEGECEAMDVGTNEGVDEGAVDDDGALDDFVEDVGTYDVDGSVEAHPPPKSLLVSLNPKLPPPSCTKCSLYTTSYEPGLPLLSSFRSSP